MRSCRFVCISDTHGKHRDIILPKGNILLHGGDFSSTGLEKDVRDIELWFSRQIDFETKIIIAGNHDVTFHTKYYQDVGSHTLISQIMTFIVVFLSLFR